MATADQKPCSAGLDSGRGYKIKLSDLITPLQLLVLRDEEERACVCVCVVVVWIN